MDTVKPGFCDGEVHVFIADESSYECSTCGFIGWPEMIVEKKTGLILQFFPHRKPERWSYGSDRLELETPK